MLIIFTLLDDDNRIILTPLTDRPDCQNGYINASYIEVSFIVQLIIIIIILLFYIGLLHRVQIHSYSRFEIYTIYIVYYIHVHSILLVLVVISNRHSCIVI